LKAYSHQIDDSYYPPVEPVVFAVVVAADPIDPIAQIVLIGLLDRILIHQHEQTMALKRVLPIKVLCVLSS
jgi:hypothetical protein